MELYSAPGSIIVYILAPGFCSSAATEQYNGSTHCFTSGLNCHFVHLEIGLFSRFRKCTDVQGPVNLSAVLAGEEAAQ